MAGRHHYVMDMDFGKLQETEGQSCLACYSPWGCKESDTAMTEEQQQDSFWALQVVVVLKNSTCQCRGLKRSKFSPWVGKIPWRKVGQLIPVFLPEKSQGERCLVGYRPQGHKELDTTKEKN